MYRRILLLAFSVFVTLFLLELFCRWFLKLPDAYAAVKFYYTPHSDTVQPQLWQGIPGRPMAVTKNPSFAPTPSEVGFYLNAQGFRGDELQPEHIKPETLRVLVLGGSTAFCLIQNDEKCWSSIVRKELAANLPRNYKEVRVLNASLPGQSLRGNFFPLVQIAPFTKPNYVVCLVGFNDAVSYLDLGGIPRDRYATWSEINQADYSRQSIKLFLSQFRIYSVVRNYLNFRENRKLEKGLILRGEKRTDENNLQIDTTFYRDTLISFIGTVRSFGATPLLVTQPALCFSNLSDEEVENHSFINLRGERRWKRQTVKAFIAAYNQTLRDVCSKEKVEFVDAEKLFQNDLTELVDDCHFSDDGCSKLGRLIAAKLLAQMGK